MRPRQIAVRPERDGVKSVEPRKINRNIKKERKMKRAIILVLALAFVVLGVTTETRANPVLEEVWVPPEVNYGEVLKIYIKGSDPDGNMRWIQVSAAGTNASLGATEIRLKKEAKREVNGYVYWDTKRSPRKEATGELQISLEDWGGKESATKSITVKVVPYGAKEMSPPSSFQNVSIGPIMLEAHSAAFMP
jgi:hypothetical protein